MSAKTVIPCALVLTVLGVGAAQAQSYPVAPAPANGAPPALVAPEAEAAPPVANAPRGLSDWITHTRSDCCGPLGGDPPIDTELFLNIGPTVPIAGKNFDGTLQVGWAIQGGGRILLYDPAMDAAWGIEASISNVHNQGQHTDRRFTDNAGRTVTIRGLNRTFVNLGGSREWFLTGPARSDATRWRAGLDFGGGWGTSKLETFEFISKGDVIGQVYLGGHVYYEIPYGCCTFYGGVRTEWAYTWTDLLVDSGDIMDLNFLLTLGVRY